MTDKQLLQLSKVELVAKYRELEEELKLAKTAKPKKKEPKVLYKF